MRFLGSFLKDNYLFYSFNKKELKFENQKNEIIYRKEFNEEITILAYTILLNKCYIVLRSENSHIISAFILDLKLNKCHDILLTNSNVDEISSYSLNKYSSFIFEENQLIIIGGLTNKSVISTTIYSFDISLYTFKKEKYSEFTLYPRYRHGSISYNGIIYVLGGFIAFPESEKKIADDIQFAKYENGSIHKFHNGKIEDEKPIMLIDPELSVVNEQFLVAFSKYKYNKLWIMDTTNNKGKNYKIDAQIEDLISVKIESKQIIIDYIIIDNDKLNFASLFLNR